MEGAICKQKCPMEAGGNSLISISNPAFGDSVAKDSKEFDNHISGRPPGNTQKAK